jgi:uncharacterized protein with PQ loop repeat
MSVKVAIFPQTIKSLKLKIMKHLPETEEKHGHLSLHSWALYIILKQELFKSETRVISTNSNAQYKHLTH